MMNNKSYNIKGGIYLVVDPSMPLQQLLTKTKAALEAGIEVVQIWNHWPGDTEKETIVTEFAELVHRYQVPVIVNEDISLLKLEVVDGIHFDEINPGIDMIRKNAGRDLITGITCGNDFTKIEWAVQHQLTYLSFCSVFPSSSVDTCDIVDRDIIYKTRAFTSMPLFLSGGIKLSNLAELKDTGLDGIAIISGIMQSNDPFISTQQYKQALNSLHTL